MIISRGISIGTGAAPASGTLLDAGGAITTGSPIGGFAGSVAAGVVTALNLTNKATEAASNAVDVNFTTATNWLGRIRGGLGASSTDPFLAFYTATSGGTITERMRINSVGAVGIGIFTSLLSTCLHLKGAASQLAIESTGADAQIKFKNTTTPDTYIDASAATLQFFINNGGTASVVMRDGQVGINVVSPVSGVPLQVHRAGASNSSYLLLSNGDNGTSTGLYVGLVGTSTQAIINNAMDGPIFLATNSTSRFSLESGGFLGLGGGIVASSAPVTNLDILYTPGAVINLCAHNDTSAMSTDVLLGEIRGDASYSNARSASHSAASIQFRTDPTTWYMGYISFRTNGSDATSNAATERVRITSGGTLRVTSLSLGSLSAGGADINAKFWIAGDGNAGYYYHWNTGGFGEWVVNGNTLMTMGAGGAVGIGAFTTASHVLQLQSDDAAKPSSTWTVVSDAGAKDDIRPYERGLDVLRKLSPKQFVFNGVFSSEKGVPGISFVAQEAVDHAPELFKWHEPKPIPVRAGAGARVMARAQAVPEPHWTMNLHPLFFILVNACKELDARLALLERGHAAH
jgi:hypothetical protein